MPKLTGSLISFSHKAGWLLKFNNIVNGRVIYINPNKTGSLSLVFTCWFWNKKARQPINNITHDKSLKLIRNPNKVIPASIPNLFCPSTNIIITPQTGKKIFIKLSIAGGYVFSMRFMYSFQHPKWIIENIPTKIQKLLSKAMSITTANTIAVRVLVRNVFLSSANRKRFEVNG